MLTGPEPCEGARAWCMRAPRHPHESGWLCTWRRQCPACASGRHRTTSGRTTGRERFERSSESESPARKVRYSRTRGRRRWPEQGEVQAADSGIAPGEPPRLSSWCLVWILGRGLGVSSVSTYCRPLDVMLSAEVLDKMWRIGQDCAQSNNCGCCRNTHCCWTITVSMQRSSPICQHP